MLLDMDGCLRESGNLKCEAFYYWVVGFCGSFVWDVVSFWGGVVEER